MAAGFEEGDIISRGGKVLSRGNLELFREKSKFFVPRCFGAYDKNDPVCRAFCFRAFRDALDVEAYKVRQEINEPYRGIFGGFFTPGPEFFNTCQAAVEKRDNDLKELISKAQKEKDRLSSLRTERDIHYLAQNSEGLGRMPVGEIRDGKGFRDFTKLVLLRLDTKDTRLFVHPYGPAHNDAVARITSDGIPVGFVKMIIPELPDNYHCQIRVVSQHENSDGDLVLRARERYEGADTGKELTLTLFRRSATVRVRVDDLGPLD